MKNVEITEVRSPLIKVIYDGRETIVNTNSVVFRKTFLSSKMPNEEEIYLRPTEVDGDLSRPYDSGWGQTLIDYCFSIKGQRYRVAIPLGSVMEHHRVMSLHAEETKLEMEDIEWEAAEIAASFNAEAQSILRRFLAGELPGVDLEAMLKEADPDNRRWREGRPNA